MPNNSDVKAKVGVDTKQAERALKRLRSSYRSAARKAVEYFRSASRVLLSLGAAVGLASRQFASFESEITRAGALAGASKSQIEQLSKAAKELGRTTEHSAHAAASAMGHLALAGFDVNQILTSTPSILGLATNGNIDLAESTQIAASTLNAFGFAAEEMGRVVDVLSKQASQSQVDIAQLGESMGVAAPVAADYKISLEETSAALGVLGDAGIRGSEAGVAFRQVITYMTGNKDKINDLGISLHNASGEFVGLSSVISQFNQTLGDLTDEARQEILLEIFGKRALTKASILLRDNTEKLDKYAQANREANGFANDFRLILLDTVKGTFDIMLSALNGLALELGLGFSGSVRKAMVAVKDMATAVNKWLKETNDAGRSNTELVVALTIGVAKFTAAVIAVSGFAAAIFSARLAYIGLKVALRANPLGLVLTAVTLLSSAFLDWGKVLGWVREQSLVLFRQIKTTSVIAVDGVVTFIRSQFYETQEFLFGVIKNILNAASAIPFGVGEKAAEAAKMLAEHQRHYADKSVKVTEEANARVLANYSALQADVSAIRWGGIEDLKASKLAEVEAVKEAEIKKREAAGGGSIGGNPLEDAEAQRKAEEDAEREKEKLEKEIQYKKDQHDRMVDEEAFYLERLYELRREMKELEAEEDVVNSELKIALMEQDYALTEQKLKEFQERKKKAEAAGIQQSLGIIFAGNKKFAALSKALNIYYLREDLIVKPAKAFAETASKYPFPKNLYFGAIAALKVSAPLIAAIGGITSLKLARGGFVGRGNSTGDTVLTSLNRGELVVPGDTAYQVLEAVRQQSSQGGGGGAPIEVTLNLDGEQLTQAVVRSESVAL